nr:ECF transporter S component [bacterium]
MKKLSTARWVAYTGLLLALALLFQAIRLVFPGVSTLIVGTLVNTVLVVAAAAVGIWSGLIISVATPIVALLQGHLPHVGMIPLVAVGNLVLVVVVALCLKPEKVNPWLKAVMAIVAGAVLKFGALYLMVVKWAVPTFLTTALGDKKAAVIGGMFAMPQLYTALMGGVLGFAVLAAIRPILKKGIQG